MKRIASDALLLRSVAYGDSDLIVTLLTETDGKVSAMVRGGRRSSRRVGGAIEPFHTIHASLEDRGGDLVTLHEARIALVRASLVANLEAVEAGGLCLRWARHLFPARTPEPDGWGSIIALLDALDRGAHSRMELTAAALNLLANVGYGLDFERCVRCGKACPSGKPAAVDALRGGLVCQSCGGARTVLAPEARAFAAALQAGARPSAPDAVIDAVLRLAEDALAVHADFER